MTDLSDGNPDELRSRVYGLLGNLLAAPPGADLLDRLRGIEGRSDADALSRAWQSLGVAARETEVAAADDEYHALFIGLGRGELVPYASFYLTGLLMERPLAELRDDLQALGIERRESVSEPEDHAGALCQVMALLCRQSGAEAQAQWAQQQAFFARHLAPWLQRFLEDLGAAQSAAFYRAVSTLGLAFLALEWRYLALEELSIDMAPKRT